MWAGPPGGLCARLGRPTCHEGDTSAKPTGGTRQIQHELAAGAAGRLLRADKVVEY